VHLVTRVRQGRPARRVVLASPTCRWHPTRHSISLPATRRPCWRRLTLATGNYFVVGKLYASRSAGPTDPASSVTCELIQNSNSGTPLDSAEVSFAAAVTQTQALTIVSAAIVTGTSDSFAIVCENQMAPDATAFNVQLAAIQVASVSP
jgi:hypothetical protein